MQICYILVVKLIYKKKGIKYMATVSNLQVLSTLVDHKASNGNATLESSELAKKLQKETVELGKVLIDIDQFCGVDEEYFDAPSEFYTTPKNTEEQFFDALDKPYKEAEETDASTQEKLEACLAPFPKEITEIVTTMISEYTGSTTRETDEASVVSGSPTRTGALPTSTEIAEEMKEKVVNIGLYAGVGSGIAGLVLFGLIATVVSIIIKKKNEEAENLVQSLPNIPDIQIVELKTVEVEPQTSSQPQESVVSKSGVSLELEEPKLGTVPEEVSESEFVKQSIATLNELEAGLTKMGAQIEKEGK